MNTNSATITIAKLKPAPASNRSAGAQDATGSWWDYWSGKLTLELGMTYDIVFSTREFGGRIYRTIQKATPVGGAKPVNGTAPQPQRTATPVEPVQGEAAFVTAVVAGAMRSGQFHIEQIAELTAAARAAWRRP
jgi:hypothetical protein